MKGIPVEVLVNRANELFINCSPCYVKGGLVYPRDLTMKASVLELYERLYDGEIIEFDLAKDRPCFDVRIGETKTKDSFIRRIGLGLN